MVSNYTEMSVVPFWDLGKYDKDFLLLKFPLCRGKCNREPDLQGLKYLSLFWQFLILHSS